MSHVDTSIGFSLRSEPPVIAVQISALQPNLEQWGKTGAKQRSLPLVGALLGFCLAHVVLETRERGWHGLSDFLMITTQVFFTGILVFGTISLWYFAKFIRLNRDIRAAGFDSPIVHLTAEGQWVTFRFASGHEFVDRWDRLLRFKSAPEFTEFEFPANPPIIIPTMAIPVETLSTISLFCTAEKIPSETKR